MSYDTATPFIASYVIVRKDGKVAFVLRSNTSWMNNYYGLPSGKVEKNESYVQAAIREAKEEIGISISSKDLKQVLTMHRYEPSKQAADWVDIYFDADKWEGDPYNAEPHMHSELKWLDPNNLPENTVTSVKLALKEIGEGNQYAEYGWENVK